MAVVVSDEELLSLPVDVSDELGDVTAVVGVCVGEEVNENVVGCFDLDGPDSGPDSDSVDVLAAPILAIVEVALVVDCTTPAVAVIVGSSNEN